MLSRMRVGMGMRELVTVALHERGWNTSNVALVRMSLKPSMRRFMSDVSSSTNNNNNHGSKAASEQEAKTQAASGAGATPVAPSASTVLGSLRRSKLDTNEPEKIIATAASQYVVTPDHTTTARGVPLDSPYLRPRGPNSRKRIVVLGCGWGGFKFLKDVDKKSYDVIVVSPRNHFLFTPLLASTTVGTLEFRSVMEPVRSVKDIHFFQAFAERLKYNEQRLECVSVFDNQRFELPYDSLVIAVGGRTQTFGIPGVPENAHFLKEVDHARRIRQDLLECFERASEPTTPEEERKRLLSFVVVGGGPTGIEFTGELYDFLVEDVRKAYPDVYKHVSVTLVEASNTVLSSFDQSLTEYTISQLKKHDVKLLFGTSVKSMTSRELTLNDGRVLPFGLCVWSTGVAPSPFVQSIVAKKDRGGRLQTDASLRILDESGQPIPNVHALGDCAAVVEHPLPATAQVASQKGAYLARYFNQLARAKHPSDFEYKHRGMLAYVGGYRAVSDIPQHPIKGFWSWVFWRGAYLTNLVSISNKILVPMYWFKSFVFGRDISRF